MEYGPLRVRKGFTLVELLVCIAIIAIAAAVLFPVFARAKTEGRKTRCQANLKQINAAFSLYASDWSDSYPNNGDPYLWMGRRWRWPLKYYVAAAAKRDPSDPGDPNKSVGNTPNILLCPDDYMSRQKFDGASYGYSLAFYHTPEQVNSMQTVDEWSGNPPPCVTQTTSAVRYPSKKALAGEWLAVHSDYRNAAGNLPGWWEPGGARNYLFADGHVKYLESSRLRPAVNGFPDINLTVDGLSGRDID